MLIVFGLLCISEAMKVISKFKLYNVQFEMHCIGLECIVTKATDVHK